MIRFEVKESGCISGFSIDFFSYGVVFVISDYRNIQEW
jgi:hypothetical protein